MKVNQKRQKVLSIINRNPEAADNDEVLIADFWRSEGWDDSRSLEDNIARVTRPETITRRRRELHNMGLIEYSEKASARRYAAFQKERDHAAFTGNSNTTECEG